MTVNRREFSQLALALAVSARGLRGAASIDDTLRGGIQRRAIPCVTAVAATPNKITYQGAFGARDSASGVKVMPDSIFGIASMTKAVTSVAAMQLVEQGKLTLDEPASKHLPDLAKLEVLDGFDPGTGKPQVHTVRTPITLKHLLTHTSGFAYPQWSEEIMRYQKATGQSFRPARVAPLAPLIFEPGTRWHYGFSTDWVGRLVETVSALSLEQYFQRSILGPLGMKDTSFILSAEKFDRAVSGYQRQPDGSLKENPRRGPVAPTEFNGGGGLSSTALDYAKFMQMILRRGKSVDGKQILRPETVDLMASNQIGALSAGKLKTQMPDVSSDVDVHPGAIDKWGLGFLINTVPYAGGRSTGSLAWAGLYNTFYWIDPKRQICAVIMMQFLPFVDKEAVGMLSDFERSVYAAA